MKKDPQKSRNKPYFCYDENVEFLLVRKECSRLALFKSIIQLMKTQGSEDTVIIAECDKKDYHIITHNTPDFEKPPKKIKIGIICIGLKEEIAWLPKFKKLLNEFSKHENFYYKTILITQVITITDRRTGEASVL